MSTTYIATPITEYAIVVDPRDNLAVVKKETQPGLEVTLADNRVVRVTAAIPPGHRFAIRDNSCRRIRFAVWPAHRNIARH